MKPSACIRLVLFVLLACSGFGDAFAAAPPRLATERFGAPALAVGSSIYVPGGYSNRGMLGSIERFDPATGVSERLPQAILPRYFHGGAVHDGKIYVAGGLTLIPASEGVAVVTTDTVEEFDPETGAVRQLPKLPLAVARPGAAVVSGRLFVIGGSLEDGTRTGAVQIYDFAKGEWSRGADMPVAREGVVMEHDGKIYAPGGYNGLVAIRDFQIYDASSNRWKKLKDLPVKLSAHHGLAVAGRLYTFGDYDILDRTAVYDFTTKAWVLLDLGYKSSRHQGVARLGDEVLVVGGNVSSSAPYLDYIQRFTTAQLAEAPRRAWEPGAEKPPVPAPPAGAGLQAFDLSGKAAPALEMELFGGGTFALSAQTGKVVVLDFWSTGCGPCVRALPEMAALARSYAGQEVVFAGVSLDPRSRKEHVAAFVKERDIPFAMGLGGSSAGKDFGVSAIPCLVVIGRDGTVQGRLVGFSSTAKATLKLAVDKLLAGEVAPVAKPAAAAARPATCGHRLSPPEAPPPDPRYFRLKWKQATEGAAGGFGAGRVDWRLPPRHLVVRAGDGLAVLDAATGEKLRTFALPEALAKKDSSMGSPQYAYLRTGGEEGIVVAFHAIYEITETGPNSRSYRTLNYQWLALSAAGEILWTRDAEQNEWSSSAPMVLPAGAGRDLLVLGGWRRFLILDDRGREVVERDQSRSQERWLFRPGAEPDSVELLVADSASLACYAVSFPMDSELDTRFFELRWRRNAHAQDVAGLPAGRLHVQVVPEFLALKSTARIEVLRAGNGETAADIAIPEAWREGAAGAYASVFLRDGAAGRAVLLKTGAGTGTNATAAALAALDVQGQELWKLELAEAAGEIRLFALPDGPDRDLLLVELWNRLLFVDAGGTLRLEQPRGVTAPPWIVRAAGEGHSFEFTEIGRNIAAWRWNPPPAE
jgi:thiol-disulfide isomerase/thioredoxin